MAKKIIQDIIVNKKIGIKQPGKLQEKLQEKPIEKPKMRMDEEIKLPQTPKEIFLPPKPESNKRKLKIICWFSGAAIIFIMFAMIINVYSSVLIKITPHQEVKNVDLELKAVRDSVAQDLNFEIMRLSKEDSVIAPATGVSTGESKASGKIIIYNTYSSSPQKLISQTRFETQDGKIYRIKDAVIVPGNGSVEAVVYADKAGLEYNIGLSDFTIPGFKSSPQYEKIYARSKTDIRGGSSGGSNNIASADDINKARDILRQKIESALIEESLKQKPDGYIFYKNALKIDFTDEMINDNLPDNQFSCQANGVAVGFLINKDELSRVLAENYIAPDQRQNVYVANLENLEFALLERNSDDSSIAFKLKGGANFVWRVDSESLIKNLLAEKDKNYVSVFAGNSDIEKAEMFFKPLWWQSIPDDNSRINIETIIKH